MIVTKQPAGTRRLRDRVRQFNKRVTNPLALTIAGRRVYALVLHQGRRSGRAYRTPVVAMPTPDGFIIPLTYGSDVDWCQNLLAAGRGTIVYRGQRYSVSAPVILDAAAALPALPPLRRRVFRLLRMRQFLRLAR